MGRVGSRVSSAFGFGVAALLCGGAAFADCAPDQVEIRTGAGVVQRFAVELADDPDERAKGLMLRDSMPKSTGMLFVFPEPKHTTFWMKNTPLPLDIIFVDATGTVTRVHENAEPQSTALIDGGPGVAFALEINAGLAGPLGIAPGAVLRHPAIGAGAAWACGAP